MSGISGGEARDPRWVAGCFGWSPRRVDGAVVVHVAGELDLSTSAELRLRLMRVVESGRDTTIVLDMSDVRFIDAHCAGLIINAWAAARCRGRQLQVAGLHGMPARVFDVLGMEPILARDGCGPVWAEGDAGDRSEDSGGVAARRSDGAACEAG